MINLTKNQLSYTMIGMVLIRLYLTRPREMLMSAGNAAWILSVYVTLVALLFFWVTSFIYKKNEDILDIADNIGGKVFKIITGMISVGIILLKTTGHIKLFIESVQIVLLQKTSVEIIILFLAVTLAIGARSGIESLSVLSGLFLPVVLLILIIFLVLLIPDFDINNLLPVLGTGTKNIFGDGLKALSIFGDLFMLNFLLPYCKDSDALKSTGFRAIILNGVVFTLFLIVYASVFPYPISSEYIFPVFQLSRIVRIGDFFGRFEAFFEFIWAISFFIYASINIWVLSVIFKKTFDLKYHEPVILPMVVFSVGIGFLQPSMLDIINGNRKFSWLVAIFAFFVPFVFGVLSKLKKSD